MTNLSIRAANIANITGYRLEDGGNRLSLSGGDTTETGTASFEFPGRSGNYDVSLVYFDENDGIANFTLYNGGSYLGGIVSDLNLGSANPSNGTRAQAFIARNVAIRTGDTLTLIGIEGDGDHARFENIDFKFLSPLPDIPPNLSQETLVFPYNDRKMKVLDRVFTTEVVTVQTLNTFPPTWKSLGLAFKLKFFENDLVLIDSKRLYIQYPSLLDWSENEAWKVAILPNRWLWKNTVSDSRDFLFKAYQGN